MSSRFYLDTDTKLTAAQRRGLEAVRDGRVARRYTSEGNVFRPPPGMGAAPLWKLESLGLIRGAGSTHTVAVELTDAGRRWPWENPPDSFTVKR